MLSCAGFVQKRAIAVRLSVSSTTMTTVNAVRQALCLSVPVFASTVPRVAG